MFTIFLTGEFLRIKLNLFVLHITFSVWYVFFDTRQTKDFNIGRTGSININFKNISSKSKFVDTIKYYQKTLAQLTMTVTDEEKKH